MPLNATQADKLVKLLGLLGSDHHGEVAAAGQAAHRLVKAAGLVWSDVIAVAPNPKLGEWREPESWQDSVWICLTLDPSPLSEWDIQFLMGIAHRSSLTVKQEVQRRRIVATCRLHSTVAA
jgi:hypothetical protein